MKCYDSNLDQTTKNARKILRFLSKNKDKISPLLILTHDFPDPDTLASAFALHYLAGKVFGIQSRMVFGGIIGRTENRQMVQLLKIPARKLRPGDFKKYSKFALVDTQPGFENNCFPKNKYATMVIDQHPFVTKPSGDLVIIDTECGATSVLLAKALLLQKIKIPVEVATALAYGILSDTLNLYRAGRADIIDTYLKILHHSDLKILAHIQNPDRSRKFFVSLGQGVQKAMARRGLVISHLGWVEGPDLVAQIADFLLTYKRTVWVLCTGRYKGKLYTSLRTSKTNVQTGEILRDIFDNRGEAGGHGAIAGGSFKVSKGQEETVWQEAETGIANRLLKRLRLPMRGDFHFPFRPKPTDTQKPA